MNNTLELSNLHKIDILVKLIFQLNMIQIQFLQVSFSLKYFCRQKGKQVCSCAHKSFQSHTLEIYQIRKIIKEKVKSLVPICENNYRVC